MKKKSKILLSVMLSVSILTGCKLGESDLVDEIKYDLSLEYNVPISRVEVKTIEYGVTIFSTNQFEIHIKDEDISFYLVAKGNSANSFRRIPFNKKEGEEQ